VAKVVAVAWLCPDEKVSEPDALPHTR
jgi:hypothetical protein